MIKQCKLCQNNFQISRSNRKYCSDLCRKEARSISNRERAKTYYLKYTYEYRQEKARKRNGERKCLHCLVIFFPDKRTRKYCSKKCADTSQIKYLDIPDCLENADRKLDKKLGYIRIYTPMHPEANTWGYVYEHRLVAENMIGRRLLPNEIVHHRNGKRWDNREENLEVMDRREHSKLKGQRDEDLTI